MARFHAKSIAHYVDEFDFSGLSNSFDLAIDNNNADATAFADVDATFLEGKASYSATVNGFFTPTAGAYDAEMFADLTAVERRVGFYQSGVKNSFGMEGKSNPSEQARASMVDGAIGLNVTWKGTDPIFRSVLLQIDPAIASTASSTKVQFGASASTQTIVGIIRLLATPGGAGDNDLIVTIESDVDSAGGGENVELTFSTINQASVALFEVKTAAGAVSNTWWRSVATMTGAGSRIFSIVVTLGIRPT